MTTITTAINFINNYFAEQTATERKSFKKFVAAMPEGLTAEQIENAYTAFTGSNPRYFKWNALTGTERETARNTGAKIVEVIAQSDAPISFTDAYLMVVPNPWRMCPSDAAPTTGICGALRRCFKEMAKAQAIDALEIRTCGRIAIRMYYLK